MAGFITERPTTVCLCESARFWRQFEKVCVEEALAGRIVLSIATVPEGDALFAELDEVERVRIMTMLDALPLHKIDLAAEVLILNVGGYIGPGTERELAYAQRRGKRIRFLEPHAFSIQASFFRRSKTAAPQTDPF